MYRTVLRGWPIAKTKICSRGAYTSGRSQRVLGAPRTDRRGGRTPPSHHLRHKTLRHFSTTLTILLFEVYLPVFVFGDGTTSANDASAHIINVALVTYIDMLLTDSIRVNVSMWADNAQTNKAFSKRCDSSKTENRIQI